MRTCKVNFVPFWRIGDSAVFAFAFVLVDWAVVVNVDAGVGSGAEVDGDESGVG